MLPVLALVSTTFVGRMEADRMLIMSATRVPWGSRAHASATEKNFHVERFKDCTESHPTKIWLLGQVDEVVVHYQSGSRSIPCLKVEDSDHCPFCEMQVPVKAGSEKLKPWTAQYEGYAAAFKMSFRKDVWEPVAVIFTAGMLKKLVLNRDTGRMYPNLRGCIISVWRRPQGNNKVLEFDFDSCIQPPIEAFDHRPIIERFFEPTLANDLPERPAVLPVLDGQWKPRPTKMSEAARARAAELGEAMLRAQSRGEVFDESAYWAEKKAKEEREKEQARLDMLKAKRNVSEGKDALADRSDMNYPHPADDKPYGFKLALPLPSEQELIDKRTGEIVTDELAARLPDDHPAKRVKGGAK
jgi:hypothetical protein